MRDFALLLMRLLFGLSMMLAHGLGILQGFSEYADKYANPIGLGSRLSMALMIFAEFFCALAVVLGLFTRLALIPLIIGMSVAFFIYHGSHSFDKKELSYLYLSAFTVLFLLGPGRFSLDAILFNRKNKEEI